VRFSIPEGAYISTNTIFKIVMTRISVLLNVEKVNILAEILDTAIQSTPDLKWKPPLIALKVAKINNVIITSRTLLVKKLIKIESRITNTVFNTTPIP
jgi:hypothetical protein